MNMKTVKAKKDLDAIIRGKRLFLPPKRKGYVMFARALPSAKGGITFKQDQSGQALMAWVLIMLVLFAGLAQALAGYTLTSVNATKRSTDFVVAGQISNEAVQDAIYQFNEGKIAKGAVATTAGTTCGVKIDGAVLRGESWDATKLGCGEYRTSPKTGKWQWTVVADPAVAPGNRYTVTATGAYGKAKRSVTVKLSSLSVTSVRYDEDKKIGYTIAPSTVFDFALFSGSDADNEGLAWAKGVKKVSDVYIKGQVGSNNLIDLKMKSSNDPAENISPQNNIPAVGFYNYGGALGWDARCNTKIASGFAKSFCEPVVRAPQKMILNSEFVSSLANKCIGTPYKWVASEQDGILNAGAGNAGCYTEMVFDRDTTVVGTGYFSAFVGGNITINPGVNIDAMGAANLVIYTSGNVSLSNGGGNTLKQLEMFVYAPKGKCELTNTQADVSQVKVVGSLACNTISLEGVSVEWKAAPSGVDQPGSSGASATTFAQKIWNADNVIEGPSGRLE
jgi:hypothetical protein